MFFKKETFLFYLPKMRKIYVVRAKDKSYATWKLCNFFRGKEDKLDDYIVIEAYKEI